MKILFVCTGNTCRSPIAQGLARKILPERFEILSSGISAGDGQPVNEKAVQVLKDKGIDISSRKSVNLHKGLLEDADYIFTMTKSHEMYLHHAYPDFQSKIKRLGDYVGYDTDISDPWGGSLDDYRNCANELEVLIHKLADKLKAADAN